MRIAIHDRKNSYSTRWIAYCQEHHIDYKAVNAYDSDIISQVKDCDIFLWHYHQGSAADMNFAKQLLFSLEQTGKIVYPDFETGWHFDDKLGQKYLFEANGIKAAEAFAFYDEQSALEWAKTTSWPKVFKLRGGASSYNVELVRSYKEAKKYIRQAFNQGFPAYDKRRRMRRTLKHFFCGKASLREALGAMSVLFRHLPTDLLPDHKGYIYFQEFIPTENYDYRIETCGDKAIAMVRYARKGDFRASGGHNDHFEHELIEPDVIQFAFDVAKKLKMQSAALDIVRNKETGELFIVEVSYCYGVDADEYDHGYWTSDGQWHDEPFDGQDWIIEEVINEYQTKTKIWKQKFV